MTIKQWWAHFSYWITEPTLKEWLAHFRYEIKSFPIPVYKTHIFINHICAVCERDDTPSTLGQLMDELNKNEGFREEYEGHKGWCGDATPQA